MTSISPVSVRDQVGNTVYVSDYDLVKDYPGQSEPCPTCGADAYDAPEGVYGVTSGLKIPKGKNVNDPVWVFSHCWKCGYRGGPVTQDQTALFAQFKQWMESQTAADLAHPTVSADNQTAEENRALRAALEKAQADLRASAPVVSAAPESNVATGGE